MSKPLEQQILDAVDEIAMAYLDGLEEQLKGSSYGTHQPNDQEFVRWFMQMMMSDPDWVRALPYVEGGNDELRRFQRIMARGGM